MALCGFQTTRTNPWINPWNWCWRWAEVKWPSSPDPDTTPVTTMTALTTSGNGTKRRKKRRRRNQRRRRRSMQMMRRGGGGRWEKDQLLGWIPFLGFTPSPSSYPLSLETEWWALGVKTYPYEMRHHCVTVTSSYIVASCCYVTRGDKCWSQTLSKSVCVCVCVCVCRGF